MVDIAQAHAAAGTAANALTDLDRVKQQGRLEVVMFVALILLIGIDPLVDPLVTVVNVQASCATTILTNTPQPLPQPIL